MSKAGLFAGWVKEFRFGWHGIVRLLIFVFQSILNGEPYQGVNPLQIIAADQ
jgi:hypothetical protein